MLTYSSKKLIINKTFHRYHADHTVVYPSMEKVLEFAESKGELARGSDKSEPSSSNKQYLDNLRYCHFINVAELIV